MEGNGYEELTCFDAPLQELSPSRRRLMARCQHKSDSKYLPRSVKPRDDKEIRRYTCSKKEQVVVKGICSQGFRKVRKR